jgi:hypothetical protein
LGFNEPEKPGVFILLKNVTTLIGIYPILPVRYSIQKRSRLASIYINIIVLSFFLMGQYGYGINPIL